LYVPKQPFATKIFASCCGHAAAGISYVAEQLGISRQAVSLWHRVPLAHVPIVESITGIDRQILRPDFAWNRGRRTMTPRTRAHQQKAAIKSAIRRKAGGTAKAKRQTPSLPRLRCLEPEHGGPYPL
jgi:DNA-binding transcriptional regulator YdaS (Cro superfamily)